MSEINYQELRERYSPQPVPKCRICGDEMTVQRICGRHITYGCTGAIYDDKGRYYAEGRSIADDHYEKSRVTVVDSSDPDVLALLDELEAETRYREGAFIACNRWHDKFREADDKLEAAERRIAEHRKVLNSLAAVARRYLPDYDEHPEIQAADELLESAAGIKVKGE